MIEGVSIEVDPEAVVIVATGPLRVVSSAMTGGGFGDARAIVNVHVAKDTRAEEAEAAIGALVRRRRVPGPWIGLCTAAFTDKAALASEAADGLVATAVVTVGLSNPVRAGLSRPSACELSTINTVVVVDAAPDAAALVNLVATVTEAKVLALADAGFRAADGALASGTSTDAVVIAATDRGPHCRFGGPASALGWAAARAVRVAIEAGARRWIEEHR